MSLDLEQRYEQIDGGRHEPRLHRQHAYRASALAAIGGFDESLGYGYDNDVRLPGCRRAGFRS
jgi:hypothetical protein